MGANLAEIKAKYPLPAYNYRVTILDNLVPYVIGFSEVSGLAVNYEPITYKHGMSFLNGDQIIPGMRQPIRITLKKGLSADGDYLKKWFDRNVKESIPTANRSNLVVDLCNETGEPVIRWKLMQVLPIKLEAPTLTANSNEVAISSMELVAVDIQIDYGTH